MLLLTHLTRVLLDMHRDVGLFVGPPAGAFLLVWTVLSVAGSARLRGLLRSGVWMGAGLVAVSSFAELRERGSPTEILREIWSHRSRSRSSGWSTGKIILVCAAFLFVLVMARPHRKFDRSEHDRLIRSAIDQWLDAAIPTLGLLLQSTEEVGDTSKNKVGDLVQKVLELRDVPPDDLPVAIEEFHQHLRNIGVEVDDDETFCWQAEDRERYEVFGHVEPGDRVRIQRPAAVLHGKTFQKGLVRKVRGGA